MNEQKKNLVENGTENLFATLVWILDSLRGSEGCPWDKKQNKKTITNYFMEEVYEALDALQSGNASSIKEELGDVLMEIVFLAKLYKEEGAFTIEDVIKDINKKMIDRHPHVFKKKTKMTSETVVKDWNSRKKSEKNRQFLFDGFVQNGPSLFNAYKIGQKVASVGFDWEKPEDAFEKVYEEIEELVQAIKLNQDKKIHEELGDALFALSNVARLLNINPELALRQANKKFVKRFTNLEIELNKEGRKPENVSLEEMDAVWEKLKKNT